MLGSASLFGVNAAVAKVVLTTGLEPARMAALRSTGAALGLAALRSTGAALGLAALAGLMSPRRLRVPRA
jgi:dihydrodipicolinate reductase